MRNLDGRALLINLPRKTVLHHMNFKARAKAIEFSPDGKFLAITNEKTVNVWRAPGHTREFAPFVLYFTAVGHHDQVTSINWSPDGRYFITASKDMTCRIYSTDKSRDDLTTTLSGHRDYIVNAWFSADMKTVSECICGQSLSY